MLGELQGVAEPWSLPSVISGCPVPTVPWGGKILPSGWRENHNRTVCDSVQKYKNYPQSARNSDSVRIGHTVTVKTGFL